MLTIRGLRKTFSGPTPRVLLAGVDLDLNAGEFIAIMGESGSGKSSLLNLVAGLDHADAGRIVFDGAELTELSDDERAAFRRDRLGFVFQAFHLLPYLNVADNVALPLVLSGCPAAERQSRVIAMLSNVGLGDRSASPPSELSGGEMQRVAIARSLVHAPKLLLADEPTGNLDPDHASQVLTLLRENVDRSGAGCILVTHSPIAAQVADRIYVLEAGVLRQRA
jgi:putative ABC transport system ATP-binding protein